MQVESFLRSMPDLLKEFDAEFAPGGNDIDVELLNLDLTCSKKLSEFSDEEPASKRSKTK